MRELYTRYTTGRTTLLGEQTARGGPLHLAAVERGKDEKEPRRSTEVVVARQILRYVSLPVHHMLFPKSRCSPVPNLCIRHALSHGRDCAESLGYKDTLWRRGSTCSRTLHGMQERGTRRTKHTGTSPAGSILGTEYRLTVQGTLVQVGSYVSVRLWPLKINPLWIPGMTSPTPVPLEFPDRPSNVPVKAPIVSHPHPPPNPHPGTISYLDT